MQDLVNESVFNNENVKLSVLTVRSLNLSGNEFYTDRLARESPSAVYVQLASSSC